MKKKQRQFLAMLLVLAMLVTTIGGTGVGETFVRAAELEETKEESNKSAETETEEGIVLSLTVAPDDMGKVIGKQGRIAKAIRTVVRAAGSKGDKKIMVDIQ